MNFDLGNRLRLPAILALVFLASLHGSQQGRRDPVAPVGTATEQRPSFFPPSCAGPLPPRASVLLVLSSLDRSHTSSLRASASRMQSQHRRGRHYRETFVSAPERHRVGGARASAPKSFVHPGSTRARHVTLRWYTGQEACMSALRFEPLGYLQTFLLSNSLKRTIYYILLYSSKKFPL